jgi:sec-independent protein translocase protein TatA
MTLLFFNIGMGEVIFALLIALLLFGSKGFPNIARQLGQGIQQVRRASGELQQDIRNSADQVKEEVEKARPGDPASPDKKGRKDQRDES